MAITIEEVTADVAPADAPERPAAPAEAPPSPETERRRFREHAARIEQRASRVKAD